LDMK